MTSVAQAAVALANAIVLLAPNGTALQSQPHTWLSSAQVTVDAQNVYVQSWSLSAETTLDAQGTHLDVLTFEGQDSAPTSSHDRLRTLHAFAPVLKAAQALQDLLAYSAPALLAAGVGFEHLLGKNGEVRFVLRALGMGSNRIANIDGLVKLLVQIVSWTEGIPQSRRLFRLSDSNDRDAAANSVAVYADSPEDAVVLWWVRRALEERNEPTRTPTFICEVMEVTPVLQTPRVQRSRALVSAYTPSE